MSIEHANSSEPHRRSEPHFARPTSTADRIATYSTAPRAHCRSALLVLWDTSYCTVGLIERSCHALESYDVIQLLPRVIHQCVELAIFRTIAVGVNTARTWVLSSGQDEYPPEHVKAACDGQKVVARSNTTCTGIRSVVSSILRIMFTVLESSLLYFPANSFCRFIRRAVKESLLSKRMSIADCCICIRKRASCASNFVSCSSSGLSQAVTYLLEPASVSCAPEQTFAFQT